MHGNRDFLLGERFMATTGCQLLADPTKIQLFGVPTLLMHGDTLCTADIRYQRFRRLVRQNWLQKLFLLLPLSLRRGVAKRLRASSRRHVSAAPDYIMDVTAEAVEQVMAGAGVRQLIHGHTHRPGIHIDDRYGKRIVLGAWHETGSVLEGLPNQEPQLKVIYP